MGLRRRHLFRLDPEHDVIYILIEPTQNEPGRIRAAFRKMIAGWATRAIVQYVH